MSSSNTDPIKDQWRVTDRVLFHYFVGCCVVVLLLFCIARDFNDPGVYRPPLVNTLIKTFSFVAVLFLGLVTLLWLAWRTRKGRNHHLMINSIFAFVLYCSTLSLWQVDFSRTGQYWRFGSAGIFQIFTVLFGVTTVVAWIRGRARSFSLQEAAFGFVIVSIFLFATQRILELDRFSDYHRELSAAMQFEEHGATLERASWSVVSIEVPERSVTDEDLKSIVEFSNLRSVSLVGNPIGDETICRISNLENLTFVNLTDTKVTDKSLECLAEATNLSRLSLRGTKVTDDGLDHLTNMRRIWYLDLGDTDISDAALEKLAHLGLKQINLQNTKVTPMGIDVLAKELPDCQIYGTSYYMGP